MRIPFATYARKDLYCLGGISLAAAAATAWFAVETPPLWLLAAAFFVIFALVVNFFRDPERTVPEGEMIVISPADGTVQDLEDVEETEFLGGTASRIGIFLSPLNVHVNRMPMRCRVARVAYRKGKMLRAFDPAAIQENESCAVMLEALGGRARLIVRQVTGAVARRIVCPVNPGEEYEAGQRYGMIKFGSRTEVWVPEGLRIKWMVGIGDKVKGGETILGVLEGLTPESAEE